jgi:hypothetical protein
MTRVEVRMFLIAVIFFAAIALWMVLDLAAE